MTNLRDLFHGSYSQIRPLSLRYDLDAVADIIEESFPLQQDPDAQIFLKELRQSARQARLMDWIGGFTEMRPSTEKGFVWVEDGRVVGNISLIPFVHEMRKIYLVANVAVRETYRKRGIARALTQHALAHLRQRGYHEIWLQVNVTNQAAIHLYQTLGFHEVCTHTTWQRQAVCDVRVPQLNVGGQMRKRRHLEYKLQQLWLDTVYPRTITWYFPVSFDNFKQNVIWYPTRWGDALKLRHWGLYQSEKCLGFVTFQRTTTFANNLWLAPNPQADQEEVLRSLVIGALRHISNNKPLRIDFPEGKSASSFNACGFEIWRSLTWMKYRPPET